MRNSEILKDLRGRLVVSCQAYPGEPLRDPRAMALMAQAAVEGGAAAIRAQGLDDIRLIRKAVTVPQIGLLKVGLSGVFITPTLQDALDVVEAGSEVVAIDGTRRDRPDGLTLKQTIAEIHARTNAMVMADVGSFDDGIAAQDAGADIVGTTLAGYTAEREKTDGPDLELLEQLAARLDLPVFAEGRIHTPEHARLAIEAGAYSVVVGTAITHPTTITSWFAAAVAC
ncbi:N-acylglucosamine-6-phosphate 2-epimerase [Okibacterium sp. HSC-33S16]|uniref:N-acetylmannosamine-6-phosphate 2-epimerase n=1 Tax=Okibacterium sp. HSC-33S16 TaxID=2910965 RepID=UPI00209E8C68|nr:N-acetylmannosamine-6-phosphate 2-epimerase [Okibacterium sp. HSC-33S16]MCP2032437.1 N-acylglucosamine-6-phosphate 2-epimerase [Okibacterium sp. HSC-33S16]